MAISDTWTLPAEAGNLDLDAGNTLGETQWDQLVSDVLYLYRRSAPFGQLAFPATQNASADANTLDDYEEGTFTPTLVGNTTPGTQTYSTQSGRYTKVGRLVHIECTILLTAKGGTMAGIPKVGGLPFATNGSVQSAIALGLWSSVDVGVGYTNVGLQTVAGATELLMVQSGDNVGAAFGDASSITNNSQFQFTGAYSV